MAITTESGIVAGFVPPQIPFYKTGGTASVSYVPCCTGLKHGGYPATFTAGSPGLAGATVNGTTSTLGGTFPFVNPISGNTYFSRATLNFGASLMATGFFDLLWYNSGIVVTTTTTQTINSVTLPARDNAGTTNGTGVTAWLYASAATGNTATITNTTITYTNSAGVTNRTGSLNTITSWPITAAAGTFMPFSLQAGDFGVQSIQSITLGTSYVSGTINLMLIREVSYIPIVSGTSSIIVDWASIGFPILYNGTALSFYVVPSAAGTYGAVSGSITYSQG